MSKGDIEVSGRSIMGLLMLAAAQNTTIHLSATGEEAEQAVESLCAWSQENSMRNDGRNRARAANGYSKAFPLDRVSLLEPSTVMIPGTRFMCGKSAFLKTG